MARNAAPLKKHYGKLTPVSERRVNGKRMVTCECKCGRTKEVYLPFLNSGRVSSCGHVLCRERKARKLAPPTKSYRPRMPLDFTPARLRKFWAYAGKHPTAEVAEKFSVPLSSTYMLLDRIRRFGDVEKFIAATGVEAP